MASEEEANQAPPAEDWCFICKDGGDLMVCDYKGCHKAYHAECVGKGESETEDHWICEWHSCTICKEHSDIHCYCCPTAVCKRCLLDVEFVQVNEDKGFCNNCLKIAFMGEKDLDIDSEGEQVDFKDRETFECLFLEYWYIIKENEGLTSGHIIDAHAQMRKGENFMPASYRNDSGKRSDYDEMYDNLKVDDSEEDMAEQKRKQSKGKKRVKRDVKSNQKEFIGWGSKCLMDFLTSIGKDASKKLSQYDVTSIMNAYIKENNLIDPVKKSKVLCDERLKSVLGRKIVNKYQIYELLESHLLENLEPLEEEGAGNNSDDEDDNDSGDRKKARVWGSGRESQEKKDDEDEDDSGDQKKARVWGSGRKSQEKKVALPAPQSCFASIIPANIKLVYLRGSIVRELLQQPENVESMVIGSFVRVKPDTSSDSKRKSHQLALVTELKETSDGNNNRETLLQVSAISEEIPLKMLSDDIFTKEECDDLRQKVKDGLLKKPTIVELEEKARMLHEVITKHWITRELALLQNLIDQANEKGWRKDLYEYMERRRVLETPSEQLRLLQKVPVVIAEEPDVEVMFKNAIKERVQEGGNAKRSNIMRSVTPGNNLGTNETSSGADGNSSFRKFGFSSANDGNINWVGTPTNNDERKIKGGREKADGNSSLRNYGLSSAHGGNGNAQATQGNNAGRNIQAEEVQVPEVIELNHEDDVADQPKDATETQNLNKQEKTLWHCVGPSGEKKGPQSLSFLKFWIETALSSKFKVWREGQSEKSAISLSEAVRLFSSEEIMEF